MLTFYTYIPRNSSASFYYRLEVPFKTARDLGLPVRIHVDTDTAGIDPEERVKRFFESDVVWLYHPIADGTVFNARRAKAITPSKVDGRWKYPPSVVIETDDNLFHVTPYNQAFRHLGTRDPEGNDLKPGHMIGDIHNGARRLLWKDKQDGFDIARNRQTILSYRQMLNLSDAVSCSTPRVADCVRADSAARRVRVFPNLVRFGDYPQLDLRQDPSRVNILWQGGGAHVEDWYPIREEVGRITKEYPHVHWTIFGQLYQWLTDFIPAERYTFVPWCPYQEYKLRLAMLNHDINLAPLAPNRFNDCRSAIKIYEATVLPKDIPTVAQRTGPYADEFVDGETAMLFDTPEEFHDKLATLIENRSQRVTIGQNAKDWVHQNRDAFKEVPKQFAFFEELRSLAELEQPHMPEEEWAAFEESLRKEDEALETAGV